MRRLVPFFFLIGALPPLASCDQRSIAAPFKSCSIVHVQFLTSRYELRVNEDPATIAETVNKLDEIDKLQSLGGGAQIRNDGSSQRILAIEECGGK